MKMTILANYRSMLGLNKMDIRNNKNHRQAYFQNSVKKLIDCDYAKNLSITMIALADVVCAAVTL